MRRPPAGWLTLGLTLFVGGCATGGSSPSAPYAALLGDPAIAGSIIWDGTSGPEAYSSWTPAQKQDLARALAAVEAGRPAGLQEAPAPILPLALKSEPIDRAKLGIEEEVEKCEDDGHVFFSAEDAWTLFLAHVAHSLWLERGRKVAWSLKDMSEEERSYLLDSRRLQKRKDAGEFEATRFVMGHALSWDPAIAYRFLVKKELLGDSPESTLFGLTSWASRNLRHIHSGETYQALYGYPGPIPIERIIEPAVPGPKKVGGCWGVTGFYAAVLRGANIPVVNSQVDGHSRPLFPTAGRFLNHGDDIYTSHIAPSGNEVPPAALLLDRREWESLVVSPAPDCVNGTCNSPKEQADYNVGRRQRLLARKFLTDGFLMEYAKKGPAYVDESLQGDRADTRLITFAKPYLSAEERKAFLAELEAELKRLGGGDLQKGRSVVDRRIKAFWGQ